MFFQLIGNFCLSLPPTSCDAPSFHPAACLLPLLSSAGISGASFQSYGLREAPCCVLEGYAPALGFSTCRAAPSKACLAWGLGPSVGKLLCPEMDIGNLAQIIT